MLYVSQQKAAHQDALMLMQTYSTSGTATHLKDAAGQIMPVVQSHRRHAQQDATSAQC